MMNSNKGYPDEIAESIPNLRRYARALTGSQSAGDAYAAAALEVLLHSPDAREQSDARQMLFRVFHFVWSSAGSPTETAEAQLERRVQDRLATLAPNSREALLLHTLEGFAPDDVAQILETDTPEAEELIAIARNEMAESTRGTVLVIEDEPIIALDIHAIVTSLGHKVTGISRTRRDAVALGLEQRPDLILADIQLADESSGIDAVRELLDVIGEIPVIFITAFPERLLTGERPEPTFLIPKPFAEEQLRAAIGQAMFFAATDMPA